MVDKFSEVRLRDGADCFRALESSWRDLERRAPSTVFQSWDWCDRWLARHSRVTPYVVTAGIGEDQSAILPLGLTKTWHGFPVRRVGFLGSGPADYGGAIVDGDRSTALAALAPALAGGFDLLDLHQLREAEAKELAGILESEYSVKIWPQEPTLVVETGADFDSYLSRLSKKFRKNTVYAARRLRRDFAYEERLSGWGEGLEGAMDDFFDLHQRRWLSKRLPGLFLGQGNRRVHQELARRLDESGSLALAISYIDDEPAAAIYGFKYGRDYSYYLGGFDPRWSKHSVSSVLIQESIKDSCERGFERFDFLRGREAYKRRWLAEEVSLFRVIAHTTGPRGRLGAALAKTENDVVQKARSRLHE